MLAQCSRKEEKIFQPVSIEEKIQNGEKKQLALHRHFGNMIPILVDPETSLPRYVLGPHFYIFIPTWLVSLGLLIFVLAALAGRASPWLMGLCVCSGINFLYFYARTGLSWPGIASQSDQPDMMSVRSERYCIPCRVVQQAGTRHCYYCDVCIYRMDHHCPWVGKCIGRDNLCLFYQFLVSTFALMGSLLLTAITAGPNSQNISKL